MKWLRQQRELRRSQEPDKVLQRIIAICQERVWVKNTRRINEEHKTTLETREWRFTCDSWVLREGNPRITLAVPFKTREEDYLWLAKVSSQVLLNTLVLSKNQAVLLSREFCVCELRKESWEIRDSVDEVIIYNDDNQSMNLGFLFLKNKQI